MRRCSHLRAQPSYFPLRGGVWYCGLRRIVRKESRHEIAVKNTGCLMSTQNHRNICSAYVYANYVANGDIQHLMNSLSCPPTRLFFPPSRDPTKSAPTGKLIFSTACREAKCSARETDKQRAKGSFLLDKITSTPTTLHYTTLWNRDIGTLIKI